MREWPAINLLDLYAYADSGKWNQFLSRCLKHEDVESLKKALYGIQAGMDDLVKKKLNSDKMNLWFIRLQRSIEQTAKQIFRKKYPNPCDNPKSSTADFNKYLAAKRARDTAFERFLRDASY